MRNIFQCRSRHLTDGLVPGWSQHAFQHGLRAHQHISGHFPHRAVRRRPLEHAFRADVGNLQPPSVPIDTRAGARRPDWSVQEGVLTERH